MLELPPLGLYVHVPWCVRKCPYCDFNSHEKPGGGIPETEYVDRLCADLEGELARATHASPLQSEESLEEARQVQNVIRRGDACVARNSHKQPKPGGRIVQTVFFGGGTPSLFQPSSFERLLDLLRQSGWLVQDAEITLEANPGTAEAARFAGYRRAGINRLSLGVQSFNDRALSRLGRIHDGGQARAAIAMAREAGFDNINIDLMFGLPGQDRELALADLEAAIDFKPEHVSWYQLTLEPNTLFWRRPPVLPEDSAVDGMQEAGLAMLEGAGYGRYEISAFSLESKQCRHNVNYWAFGDYLGVGAGAHGKLTDPESDRVLRTRKTRHPKHYLSVDAGTATREVQPGERPLEFLMNALRLRTGFTAGQFESRTGIAFGVIKEKIKCLSTQELLNMNGQRVSATHRGYRLLDSILGEFS